MSNQEQPAVDRPNVAEFINIDEQQRAHRPNGDFMSNSELAQVEAHAGRTY